MRNESSNSFSTWARLPVCGTSEGNGESTVSVASVLRICSCKKLSISSILSRISWRVARVGSVEKVAGTSSLATEPDREVPMRPKCEGGPADEMGDMDASRRGGSYLPPVSPDWHTVPMPRRDPVPEAAPVTSRCWMSRPQDATPRASRSLRVDHRHEWWGMRPVL